VGLEGFEAPEQREHPANKDRGSAFVKKGKRDQSQGKCTWKTLTERTQQKVVGLSLEGHSPQKKNPRGTVTTKKKRDPIELQGMGKIKLVRPVEGRS